MTAIGRLLRAEPAILVGLGNAGLILVAAFGINLSKDQITAIFGVLSALSGVLVRAFVTPNAPPVPAVPAAPPAK